MTLSLIERVDYLELAAQLFLDQVIGHTRVYETLHEVAAILRHFNVTRRSSYISPLLQMR